MSHHQVQTRTIGHGNLEQYRKRRDARNRAHLMSARRRRVIVRWLRRTARRTAQVPRLARRSEMLLLDRVAVVRADLLEIAATLEHAHEPDPTCIQELHELLANGCDSPLYNADIHISELRATLHQMRASLAACVESGLRSGP